MNSIDWQLCTTLAIVAIAATVVTRRVLAFVAGRRTSPCDSCPSKSAEQPPTDKLVAERDIKLMFRDSDP